MSEPTKDDLLEFMKKHGPEKVDSITDTESAIRHFRCTSKVYKEQRNQYKSERDTLIDDLSWYKAKVSRLERHKALNNEFSQHIGNKPSSSTYKYFRAKLDELGIKEGE